MFFFPRFVSATKGEKPGPAPRPSGASGGVRSAMGGPRGNKNRIAPKKKNFPNPRHQRGKKRVTKKQRKTGAKNKKKNVKKKKKHLFRSNFPIDKGKKKKGRVFPV